MFPVLFSLGNFTLQTFSVFLLVAFLLTGFVFWRKGKEEHYAEDEIFDAFLLALFWGALASRLGFIAFHYQYFGVNPLKWIDIFSHPGSLPVVGTIVAFGFLFRYAKKQKWNAFEVLDLASLSLSLGTAITWLGAFFAGTSFGNPTSLPWGVTFPNVFDRRHPTQLYGFILYLILFVFLLWSESRYRTFSWYRAKHSAQTGFLFSFFWIFFGLYGVFFSVVMPNQLLLGSVPFDIPVRVLFFLFGCMMLYLRSGRGFSLKRK